MTTRATFLATVRSRLAAGVRESAIRPLAPVTTGPVRYAVDLTDPVGAFTRAAQAVGAEVIEGDDLAGLVGGVVGRLGAQRVVVSDDPECDGVAAVLTGLGVEILPHGDPAVVATADLGITGAAAGIALTGSLVVGSRRAGTRLASLLPPVHLALLPQRRIVPTPGDLMRGWSEERLEVLGSNVVLITGPSRSADIELQLTVGVHGPERVLIALV
jgi:L-lactate dehydrogenase complex protein LldG